MYKIPLPASQVSNKEASFGKGATWEKKARVILEEWNKESQHEIPQAVEKNVYTFSCNPHTVILAINECVQVEPGPDLSLGIGVLLATAAPESQGQNSTCGTEWLFSLICALLSSAFRWLWTTDVDEN